MKKKIFRPTVQMFTVEEYEGESIEKKIQRVLDENQPITDGADFVYTEKAEGVRPEFDVRTDKWEIANEAMEAVNKSKIAKSKDMAKSPDQTEGAESNAGETKTE